VHALIPVTVITGFLGTGKTTVLNALLRDPAFSETAVLINEFGNVQIDHDLVADFSDEYVMTTTGCLCCTASSDIEQSLPDLWTRREAGEIAPFKRVLVETTGLIDPIPVIAAFLERSATSADDQAVRDRFALSRVVTLFDIVNGASTLDHHSEALKQVALADVILLTKTDLAHDPASRRDIAADRQRIAAINSSAVILDRHADWPRMRDLLLESDRYDLRGKGDDAVSWLAHEQAHAAAHHDHGTVDTTRHDDDICSHVIIAGAPVSPIVFSFFLDAVKMIAGADLLRLKGLVALSDDPSRPLVVHGVQHLVHPIARLDQWPNDDQHSRIVIIGRNIQVDALRNILDAGAPSAEPAPLA